MCPMKISIENQEGRTDMTDIQFEETMKDAMISSYIKVMGSEKWNSLTNDEKNSLLHIMVKGFVEPMLKVL